MKWRVRFLSSLIILANPLTERSSGKACVNKVRDEKELLWRHQWNPEACKDTLQTLFQQTGKAKWDGWIS